MMGYGPGMGLGWLFMGLFWVALLGLVAWLVLTLAPTRRQPDAGTGGAEEILDRRFARGEIDEETYRSQRAALGAARREPR